MNVYIFNNKNKINLSFIKIHPGEWVVIKPNLVKESKENDKTEWESVITSTNLIELVCSYVCEQLNKKGKVTICDAPQTDSSFSKIAERLNLYTIAERCQNKYGITVEVIDLRNEEWVNDSGIITKRLKLKGDPNGVIKFNLGRDSLFWGYNKRGQYYGADYNSNIVNKHHFKDTHEYLICSTPIKADVFINLPKMKTHKKTGVTLCLKNLVGINADKNWLPHHTEGSPKNGGDQFPDLNLKRRIERYSVKIARNIALNIPYFGTKIAQKMRDAGINVFGSGDKTIRSGNWYGNDTTWRMALDLNRCLIYGNSDGTLRNNNPKRYYCLIDGIVGMEGLGPMQGDPVRSNVIIGGTDPVATDLVTSRIMGFDWRKIPIIREAFKISTYPITTTIVEDINIISDMLEWNGKFLDIEDKKFLNFKPHFGWISHIEYEKGMK